jgi:HK97 family phage major capsid protein
VRSQSRSVEEESRMLVDNAKRAVEQFHFPHENAEPRGLAGAHRAAAAQVLRQRGAAAVRTAPARHRQPRLPAAFGKAIAGQPLTTDEQRSLSLTSASGGYAVPVTLDPTIIPTSNGAVNPWRAISRVEQITGNTWNGVSAGASSRRVT